MRTPVVRFPGAEKLIGEYQRLLVVETVQRRYAPGQTRADENKAEAFEKSHGCHPNQSIDDDAVKRSELGTNSEDPLFTFEEFVYLRLDGVAARIPGVICYV